MKLIIDIPDIIFQKIERRARIGLCDDADEQIIYSENFMRKATNGEVIKALFPNAEIRNGETNRDRNVIYILMDNLCVCHFRADWWNAPYKKGENNE